MNVASLELCRELYELAPKWFDTFAKYYDIDGYESLRPSIKVGDDFEGHILQVVAPAYDLGYLLRKLPPKRVKLRNNSQEGWGCQYDPQRRYRA